jgi:hypothetical protein
LGDRGKEDTAANFLADIGKQYNSMKKEVERPGISARMRDLKESIRAHQSNDHPDVYIYSASYTSFTKPGGNQSVGLTFYSYRERQTVVLSCFFGLGQFLKDVGQALVAREKTWPQLSTELIYLEPKKLVFREFTFTVPQKYNTSANVYWANLFLWGPVSAPEDRFYGRMYVPVTVKS